MSPDVPLLIIGRRDPATVASGAKTDRPELAKLLRRIEPGDVLVVTRLDRLARSTRDLLNVLDEVAKRGAGFRSLKDTWASELHHNVFPVLKDGDFHHVPPRATALSRKSNASDG